MIPGRGGSPRPPASPKHKHSFGRAVVVSSAVPEQGRSGWRREESQHTEKRKGKKGGKTEPDQFGFCLLACPQWLDVVGNVPGGLAVAIASWRPVVGSCCR